MSDVEYFSMQGRVYIGERNADGSRKPARWVYDASTLETKQSKDQDEKAESNSGLRGTAATMTTKRGMTVALTLGQLSVDNAALALDGVRVDVVSGSVVAEAIGDVKAGDVVALEYAAISGLELSDGAAAALVVDTDYTVDETLGVVTFLTTKTGVTGDYDYAAHSLATAFTADRKDHYIVFAGLNTVDGSEQRCRGELYNVTMNPAESFGFIHASFGDLSLTGTCKMDPVRAPSARWGGYGRVILVDGE